MKPKVGSLEKKTNHTDKPLASWKLNLLNAGIKGGTSLLISQKQKKILREYYEQSYASKLDNLNVRDKFLERHNDQNRLKKK